MIKLLVAGIVLAVIVISIAGVGIYAGLKEVAKTQLTFRGM